MPPTPPIERDRATPRAATRACVGCGVLDTASAMLRLVVESAAPTIAASDAEKNGSTGATKDVAVAFDLAGGSFGRGAHVHPRVDCLLKALKGLSRAFRQNMAIRPADLGRRLVDACEQRMCGLLLAARRRGDVIVGTDASLEALRAGAPLAIVATDAGGVASRREVAQAVAEGRAVAWGRKNGLGALFGDQEVAICVVCHDSIAAELKRMRAVADAGATVMATETATSAREGAGCSRRPEAR